MSCGLIFGENSDLLSSEKVVFLPQGVEIELIFALWALDSKIRDDFQNYIWAIDQSFTYALFLPQGVEIELIFAVWATVPTYTPIFKIAIFGHKTWPWPKCQKLHIYSLYPRGSKFSLFSLYRQQFPK